MGARLAMRTLLLLICLPVLAWGQDSIKVQPIYEFTPQAPFKAIPAKTFTVTFTVVFDSLTLAEAAGYESEFRWRLPKGCQFNVTVGERSRTIYGTGLQWVDTVHTPRWRSTQDTIWYDKRDIQLDMDTAVVR